ncbi:HNH endonuclease signature motif containing protein [Mycoplasma seminis]|uniref:HNH endonuclease signature motif containing protein n=1 Tax=Mycoplasma seminis TaxID=512749 RepID=A0ABY9H9L0_9MOLU|nr:HNH endonuclease signature motif containing protein [Mycoplasma seminis]WLP85262.1 HNH endonuclease signature motif containing protein [Mycoplasma seminis]
MSKEWSNARQAHLSREPYCVKCGTTLNLQVDHIIEHNNTQAYFLAQDNLQTLCIKCHGLKTFKTQKLRSLKVDNSKKIKLVFASPRGLVVSDSWMFLNAYINFYQVGNVIYFYFSKALEDYTFKEVALIIEFLCSFFYYVKYRIDNIDCELIANHLRSKLLRA